MFEPELARIRARLEKIGRKSRRFHLNRPATLEQLAAYEKTLGLALPDEFREFLLQVTSGACAGDKDELQFGPLIPENNDGFRFSYGGGGPLVVFPLQYKLYDEYQCTLRGWDELSGHEKMESDVALCFGVWGPYKLATIVLNGPERGQVWHGSNWRTPPVPSGQFFLTAFWRMLDQTS